MPVIEKSQILTDRKAMKWLISCERLLQLRRDCVAGWSTRPFPALDLAALEADCRTHRREWRLRMREACIVGLEESSAATVHHPHRTGTPPPQCRRALARSRSRIQCSSCSWWCSSVANSAPSSRPLPHDPPAPAAPELAHIPIANTQTPYPVFSITTMPGSKRKTDICTMKAGMTAVPGVQIADHASNVSQFTGKITNMKAPRWRFYRQVGRGINKESGMQRVERFAARQSDRWRICGFHLNFNRMFDDFIEALTTRFMTSLKY